MIMSRKAMSEGIRLIIYIVVILVILLIVLLFVRNITQNYGEKADTTNENTFENLKNIGENKEVAQQAPLKVNFVEKESIESKVYI